LFVYLSVQQESTGVMRDRHRGYGTDTGAFFLLSNSASYLFLTGYVWAWVDFWRGFSTSCEVDHRLIFKRACGVHVTPAARAVGT